MLEKSIFAVYPSTVRQCWHVFHSQLHSQRAGRIFTSETVSEIFRLIYVYQRTMFQLIIVARHTVVRATVMF